MGEKQTAAQRAALKSSVPGMAGAYFAFAFGLFIAWWGSFHEIACGCISIRSNVPLMYTYFSCYAHSVGCILGALLCGFSFKRVRPSLAGKAPFVAFVVLAFCGVGFYVALGAESWLLAAAMQTALNTAAVFLAIIGIMAMSKMPVSDTIALLFICLCTYVLFNNMLLPALVYALDSSQLVAIAQLCILVVIWLLVSGISHDTDKSDLLKQSLDQAARSAHPQSKTDSKPQRVALQPLFHLAVYSFVFGIMHVESSTLIGSFFNRNLPYAAGAVLAVMIFYFTFMRKASTPYIWPKIHSVIFPLTVISFMLLPDLNTLASYLPVTFINCSYLYYDALFVLGCLAISRESAIPLTKVLVIGFSTKFAFYVLGVIACHLQLAFLPGDVTQTPLTSVAVFVLLVAATFWMGDALKAKKLWGMRVELSPERMHELDIREKSDRFAKAFRLSPKEREIVQLLAQGRSTEEITNELYISMATTRTHIRNIYAKADVHSRKELERCIFNA